MSIKLAFMSNEGGEEEGLNHSGVETFRNSLFESLARECGQNSADAFKKHPVKLEFELLSIKKRELPALLELEGTLDACLKKVKDVPGKSREMTFFKQAMKLVRQSELPVLRISDLNTTGLEGPSQAGKPFHSLVKSDGVSSKRDDGAGGSFGIGKYAAYAASALRTVFYSTVYLEQGGRRKRFLAQGKSLLMSHKVGRKEFRRTGYWGQSGFNPETESDKVPQWMRRNDVGTSLFVMGFMAEQGWLDRMRAAIAQNFLWAIHRGELEVSIKDATSFAKIDRDSLGSCFSDTAVLEVVRKREQLEAFEFAKSLYEALVDPSAIDDDFEVDGLGQVRMRTLVREKLPKRAMIIRNGLAITDSLEKFGDRLARFPGYRDFVTFVEPVAPAGRALIRDLENPQHNELSPERITDESRRGIADAAMRKLRAEIRERLKQHARPPVSERMTLDEMSEFFADVDPTDKPPADEGEPDPETAVVTDSSVKRSPPVAIDADSTEGAHGGATEPVKREVVVPNPNPNPAPGQRPGAGPGEKGQRKSKCDLSLIAPRNALLNLRRRRLHFTSSESAVARLSLVAIGLTEEAPLTILRSSAGTVSDGCVILDVRNGERLTIEVDLPTDYSGPLLMRLVKEGVRENS
jgi:hypothetical protein